MRDILQTLGQRNFSHYSMHPVLTEELSEFSQLGTDE